MPTLTFRLKLPKRAQPTQINGTLMLDSQDKEYSATSGLSGVQYLGGWTRMGRGPLPPSDKITEKYEVSTEKQFLASCTCTEGFLYQILPAAVTADGVTRGNFSIHFGAGLPGTTGCIFINDEKEWQDFQLAMENLAVTGITSIPLEVIYT